MPWARYVAALRRHLWFIVAMVVLGTVAGVAVSRRVAAEYEVRASVWVTHAGEGGGSRESGPIRAAQLLSSNGWPELYRSYSLADSVVKLLRLNVQPKLLRDTALFDDFEYGPTLRPGRYALRTDSSGKKLILTAADGTTLEKVALGDSVGSSLGFRWRPPAGRIVPNRVVEFSVMLPRDASAQLINRLVILMPENGNFIRLGLTGINPQRDARTLNTWSQLFVASATELKKHSIVEFKKLLEAQLQVSERELRTAEINLERYRYNTITLPSENNQLQGGVQETQAPVISAYFEQRSAYDSVRSNREALERLVNRAPSGGVSADDFLSAPGVLASSPALLRMIGELNDKRANLRTLQQTFTDAHPQVRAAAEGVRVLEQQKIPDEARNVLRLLRDREKELSSRIAGSSKELKEIPARTIEEARMRRQMLAAENLYNNLKNRYEEVKLAEAGTTPDVSIRDTAVAPRRPSSNQAPRILLLAIAASFGAAVGLALIRDRVDRRFRYPEQVTHDLGLAIAGTVPRLKPGRRGQLDVAMMAQVVESFRALRLGARYNFELGSSVCLTVSSPSPGDGKSLVSSNLAVSFANAGCRTLLIDGDTRRGGLHGVFGLSRTPGLVEFLYGEVNHTDIVRSSPTPNLYVIASGARRRRAPELLASDRMRAFIQAMRQEYDAVIVDTPPLSAGMDAYALGVTTGSMLLVLRHGTTDRKLAAAKLEVLDRLPVRLLGAVLNGIDSSSDSTYKYYGYTEYGDKETEEEAPFAVLARG